MNDPCTPDIPDEIRDRVDRLLETTTEADARTILNRILTATPVARDQGDRS